MVPQAFAEELPTLVHRYREDLDIPLLEEGLLWRDLLQSKRGTEIIEHATSPFALQRAGLFSPQMISLLRSFWLILPRNSRLLRDLDVLMGFVIRQQLRTVPEDPSKAKLTEWESFVLRHTKPMNHFIHLVSMLMFYVSPFIAWYTWNPWWLILFFLSGFMGTFGHFITQDGGVSLREATTQQKVPLYVIKMFFLIVTGRYGQEIEAAKAKL